MTTGTGIFLAALIIGGVLLFNGTKDRWDWRKIGKYFICIVAFIAFLAIGLVFHYSLGPFFKFESSLAGLIAIIAIMNVGILVGIIFGAIIQTKFEEENVGTRDFAWIAQICMCGTPIVALYFGVEPLAELISKVIDYIWLRL